MTRTATLRRLMSGAVLIVLIVLGLGARAGSSLLALPAPAAGLDRADPTTHRFAEPGPHPVGLRRLTADQAPVPLSVWYPAAGADDATAAGGTALAYTYGVAMFGPESTVALATYPGRARPGAEPDPRGGPYPLVVISPGFAISSGSYAWLAEHLASYGFVVVSPQHRESLDPRTLWRATVDRPREGLALLTYLDHETRAGGRFAGLIDTRSVAVVGHSYGGYTALALGGARLDSAALRAACADAGAGGPLTFQCDALLPHLADMAAYAGLDSVPEGLWPSWADPRVDAVVPLAGDAAMFGPEGLSGITAPVLAIGGTADADSPFAWGTGAAYAQTSSDRKIEIALVDAEHLLFAGGCENPRTVLDLVATSFCADPAWDRTQAHDLIAHYATAFLRRELAGDAAAGTALSQAPEGLSGLQYQVEGY